MNKLKTIQKRLKQFKNLSEEQKFKEFQFCLITPQSNAQKCWEAIEEISRLKRLEHKKISEILSKKTRFHNTKTKRIMESKKAWKEIKPLLKIKDSFALRNILAKKVNGYGLKESSHFLRNIGLSNNRIAILDRHILKNLHNLGLIPEAKIKSQKQYLEIEQIFLAHAERIQVKADELDLHWWSQENGKIFK